MSSANLHATGGTSASQSQRVTGSMGLGGMNSFNSQSSSFLARAEAARANESS